MTARGNGFAEGGFRTGDVVLMNGAHYTIGEVTSSKMEIKNLGWISYRIWWLKISIARAWRRVRSWFAGM